MGFSSKVRKGTSKKKFPAIAKRYNKMAGKANPPVRGGKRKGYTNA